MLIFRAWAARGVMCCQYPLGNSSNSFCEITLRAGLLVRIRKKNFASEEKFLRQNFPQIGTGGPAHWLLRSCCLLEPRFNFRRPAVRHIKHSNSKITHGRLMEAII